MLKPKSQDNTRITTRIDQATQWLKSAQLLSYPSESVWGLGCDAFCQTAVSKLLHLKNRPIDKGLIVLCDSALRLLPLLKHLDDDIQQRIMHQLQQPPSANQAQTWLIPVQHMPHFLTGKNATTAQLAVRITTHPQLKQLCQALISPQNPYGFLVSTSCNPNTYPAATDFFEAYDYFANQVAYLLGETLGFDKPSKINDSMTGAVLRC